MRRMSGSEGDEEKKKKRWSSFHSGAERTVATWTWNSAQKHRPLSLVVQSLNNKKQNQETRSFGLILRNCFQMTKGNTVTHWPNSKSNFLHRCQLWRGEQPAPMSGWMLILPLSVPDSNVDVSVTADSLCELTPSVTSSTRGGEISHAHRVWHRQPCHQMLLNYAFGWSIKGA